MAGRWVVRYAALATTAILLLLLLPNSPFKVQHKSLEGWYKPAVGLNTSIYNPTKWFFEAELPAEWYPPTKFNVEKLKAFPPRHYKGPGHPTFATVFTSRDAGHQDPYFLAMQQMTYRLLWDPRSESAHPFTIFVAPFIPQDQRDILSAAGANVVEIELFDHEQPVTGMLIAVRLRDMFSKLQMWNQTQFSRIAYLDSDAFPIAVPDAIFDEAVEQQCKKGMLGAEDQEDISEVCKYVMSAYMEFDTTMNAGVMVFNPSTAMYNRLARMTKHTDKYDSGMMEQAFLSYAYSPSGPFPPQPMRKVWNGSPDGPSKGEKMNILHAKLWAMFWPDEQSQWCASFFNDTWKDMNRLYSSPEFEQRRAGDGVQLLQDFENANQVY